MKTKLITIILAASSISAFADGCINPATPNEAIQCMVNDFNSRVTDVKTAAQEVYNNNETLISNAYQMREGSAAAFNFKAAYQLTPFLFTWAGSAGKDVAKISSAIKDGNFNAIPALYTQYKTDRAALFTNSEVEYAAYDTVFGEAELMAKAQGVAKESKAVRSANYAANMYIGYLVPATLINAYQFAATDAPKYINDSLNTMTQQMCQAQAQIFQNDATALADSDTNIQMLLDAGAPGSVVKKAFANLHVNYVVDALNTTYAYATGKSPLVKGQAYDVCDYNTFQNSVQSGNVFAIQLNKTVNSIAKQTGNKVAPQNIYWALTAVSSQYMDKAITKPGMTPVAGAAVLPY